MAILALLTQGACRKTNDAQATSRWADSQVRFTVKNTESVRRSEIIEVPLAAKRRVSRVIRSDGTPVIFQVLDIDGKKTLLALADLPPLASEEYFVAFGDETLADQPLNICSGRHVPERMDDYAWENDRIAFRIYGPALGANPKETSGSGIDVWAKRVGYPIIDKWYAHGDYHRDHGEGLDAYNVGETRGCGGSGVYIGDKMFSAKVWNTQRTLAVGPLRVMFEVAYPPYRAGDAMVTETKRISLDRGSFFNRIQAKVQIEGADSVPFAVGIARQKNEEAPMSGPSWAATMEPEALHGRIGAAIIMKGGELVLAGDHALLVRQAKNGETIEYFAGACWTKEGTFSGLGPWAEHTRNVALPKLKPLVVELIDNGSVQNLSRVRATWLAKPHNPKGENKYERIKWTLGN